MPPINTQTKVISVAIDGDLPNNIETACDAEGLAGRRLAACFVAPGGGSVVLIFQAP